MKILIIKLGYSETLINDDSKVVSLGDVLRTTPVISGLAKKYPGAQIEWLTSQEAATLVAGTPGLKKTHIYNRAELKSYDLVINLEKSKEIFELIKTIKYRELRGFSLKNGAINIEPPNKKALSYIEARGSSRVWQEVIFEILGLEWRGEPYALGYRPEVAKSHAVGLNHLVGSKWPTKAMPHSSWEALARKLSSLGLTYSWQEGKENLKQYIEWIASCKTIITQDSLGMHLAMALGKNLVAIFGPTAYSDMHFYGPHRLITPELACPLMPCFLKHCPKPSFCMDSVSVEAIARAALELTTL